MNTETQEAPLQTNHSPLPPVKEPVRKEPFLGELIRFILISLAIVIPLRMYVAEPFVVSGSSMFPTFETGNYLIVDQVSYRFDEPERGDVVVFEYPVDPSKFFIKRVIGLPGETIQIRDSQVVVINDSYPDGLLLDEPYIGDVREGDTIVTLNEGDYFVMGDNRAASSDSRVWGPLPEENIVGKVFLRLFPIKEVGSLPGQFHQ